jgi:DNA-binding transcriptional LysR family regulator
MRSLNLDQLRALIAVVETRSFSAASRQLHLSQPAVSVQIRELERRFGVRLIERLGKQAHATPPGRDLVDAATRIIREVDNAESTMRRYREGWIGRVRIGTANTALTYLLPPVLRRLSVEHPGIDLHIRNLPTRENVEALQQNEVDIAIVTLPVDRAQLKITPLLTERMIAILPASLRNIPDVVTPEYAVEQPLLMEHTRAAVYALVAQWISVTGKQPRVPMHLGTIEALCSAVSANLGMTIIPEMGLSGRESEIVVRPLDPPLARTLALAEHISKPDEPALALVRQALLTLRDTAGDRKAVAPSKVLEQRQPDQRNRRRH